MDKELYHHGIKGMKWGIRRYQNPDGTLTEEGKKHYATKNLKNATIKNLHMWGKDPNHNVLYITGPSGTGKSTTALGLANTKDSIIHLDTLFDEKEHAKHGNNRFDDFCKNQGIDIDKARDLSLDKKDRWKIIDTISDQIEPYGKKCFNEGTKVIVEGVQLADETMFPDKTYFKDKPFISLNTSKLKSAMRAATRDNDTIKNKLKEFLSQERSDWYDYVQNNINNMELMHHGIKGQKWGVKNGPPYPLNTIANGNAVLLKDYNGPAYFISEKKLDGQVLTPRVPDNFLTKNGYEDSETMRVSFAPSIEKCLAGLSQNLDDKEFYVYEPHDISQCEVYKPNEKAVPDSKITDELWIVEPVELKQVKRIKITGNTGSDGKSYKYGDQEAILFDDWTYEDVDTN